MVHTGSLLGTGMVLGMLHVLTGPDHLSALATLSANTDPWAAMRLGVRWGMGHSVGLLLVGSVLIAVTNRSPAQEDDAGIHVPDRLSTFFESLVGLFMLVLGSYGFYKAWTIRPKPDADMAESGLVLEQGDHDDSGALPAGLWHDRHNGATTTASLLLLETDHERTPQDPSAVESLAVPSEQPDASVETDMEEDVVGHDGGMRSTAPSLSSCCAHCVQRLSTGSMALLAGVIHGLAGPGGVLGVIPAVQLHDWRLATVYLGSFCLMSIVTMGAFALVYGGLSQRIGVNQHRQFLIQFVSSGLSVLVGVLWLVLLAMGKLDVVFP